MNTHNVIDYNQSARGRILDYIKSYVMQHCYPPTIREIANGVGLKSSATVHEHIKMLIEYGFLETDAESGSNRALRLPNMKITIG